LSSLLRRLFKRKRTLYSALIVTGFCALSLIGWQARAALPRWMQDVIAGSAIESALYRSMDLPGMSTLYPRPPKEAREQLTQLVAKAPQQAELYSLRAMQEERSLDFKAAEADWKAYVSRSNDSIAARVELADYYHRRMQATDEVRVLMQMGASAVQPAEQYIAAAEQQSWKAFERVLLLAGDQRLEDEVTANAYAAWIARYPQQRSLYAREFQWLLTVKKYEQAEQLIAQYRRAFSQDAVFPLKAKAALEYNRGSAVNALAIYDKGFDPLWPVELVQSYYALLGETHNQRRFTAEARARLASNADDLNAMARLFYYAQQQGHLEAAEQIVEAYRQSKESRKAQWSAQELYTLARLTEAIHEYPAAARFDFALYHMQGTISSGQSAQAEGLSSMIRILLEAPEQPVELGSGNLSVYRDIATLDHGPGYWNGILSLWLNSTSPEQAYHDEEQRAQPYFHRAKAAELLTLLDKEYPATAARADLHKELIGVLADYDESALVLKAGNEFLADFSDDLQESSRVQVAMHMADAYARLQDTKGEFALYDRMLTELSTKTGGMPLTAASASTHKTVQAAGNVGIAAPGETATSDETPDGTASPTRKDAVKSGGFNVTPEPPEGVLVAGAQEYQQLLERYVGRLTTTGHLPQALAVLRKELDRNPNDPLLYERLASFLQQNNLSQQQEEVYNQAILRFQDKGWYDKLARLLLREKKREAFADLTKQVVGIFKGTVLEEYFQHVNQGGPQLFLQLNLYAHQRFPHDEVFVSNLLQAYQAKTTRDPAAWERLLREHWSDSASLKTEFFDYLSRTGKLDAELTQLHALVPGVTQDQTNPAATQELAEVQMWRSHFEESAPLLGSLADAYPGNEEIGTQASSVYRSLAYFDAGQIAHAVAIEQHLLAEMPAHTDRLAHIGDIYADWGSPDSTGHENIMAAAPYWRRIPAVHPGSASGYLESATIFWDYFQFDDALDEIHEARTRFSQPALYGYEAGAIEEGKRNMPDAVREYTLAAVNKEDAAAIRLVQLARRKATAALVDEATAGALKSNDCVAALKLRERILKALKRDAEIAPLLEVEVARASTLEHVQAIAAEAQLQLLSRVYEIALTREITLANDPVQKIQLSYELVRSYEGNKDIDDAGRVIDQVYRDNAKLIGVVRTTADFYWRNKQGIKAITILTEAAKTAKAPQPVLSRQYVVEAARKANESGAYAQARSLMAPLINPDAAVHDGIDPYNAEYLAVVADSYARAGDYAHLKEFYESELELLHVDRSIATADDRKQKSVLLRRGLIPALTCMKDFSGAMEQYVAILSAYPEDANEIQEASRYAVLNHQQQSLVAFVGNTAKASPKDARFATMLALIQSAFENYPAAIEAYTHAIAIRADRADSYTARADLEERLYRLDDAAKDYERLYVLSYRNADWMVKLATARARQGRKEEAVKALERAWIEGHPSKAADDFRVATQLERWNMLEESLYFADMGVRAEGDDLLAGSGAGNQSGDDPSGAVIYMRLMTRMRQADKALATLDTARKSADLSPNSPAMVIEQVEKQGLASVSDVEWRKRRTEQRQQTATQRFNRAIQEMGKTVGIYFTPEEKQKFAQLVNARWASVDHAAWANRSPWIEVAKAAAMPDVEARMRKRILLDRSYESGAPADSQVNAYEELERSRMEYTELARTLEAYALLLKPEARMQPRIAEAQAYRDSGDELAELRTLGKISFSGNGNDILRERYLQLLLKHDVAGFEAYASTSKDDASLLAAPNYAAVHADLKIANASVNARAKVRAPEWKAAYSALLGLYFHDAEPGTEAAFHSVLGDERTIGERIAQSSSHASEAGQDSPNSSAQLAGTSWFYYGMRYGVYRTLSPEKDWPQRDPEDFLAAGVERNPASANNYIGLASAYADAGKADRALVEYRHALELAPDLPAVYDAMAVLLWQTNRKEEAIAEWRNGLASLNRVQDKGPAPESFWIGFDSIAQHLSKRLLTAQLQADMDSVLRTYLARNGNYRSQELLKAAFEASPSPGEGIAWILSLSSVASSPAQVLMELDTAAWLPVESREAILLRELELDRSAASLGNSEDGYLVERLERDERELTLYYFALKQDTKAQALLQKMTDSERNSSDLVQAEIVAAARGKRLDALLATYRAHSDDAKTIPRSDVLRSIAGGLASANDKTSALAIWEYVFERGQMQHNLMASDYLGLAQARIAVGNVSGGVELLRKMTLLIDDAYTNDDLAAALLEKSGHAAEAIEFLAALTKGVPWDAAYSIRLAQAQLQAGRDMGLAQSGLRDVASQSRYAYDLRVQAASTLRAAGMQPAGAAGLGSGELDLLASGKTPLAQVRQPYFAAARIFAADTTKEAALRSQLLREAVSIRPSGTSEGYSVSSGFDGYTLRMNIFRAEVSGGHNATALSAVEPLLNGTYEYAAQASTADEPAGDEGAGRADANSRAETDAFDTGEQRLLIRSNPGEATLEELESHAPVPRPGNNAEQSDSEMIELSLLIANAYEHNREASKALPYLKLTAFLQKDTALHAELQGRVDKITIELALEARNALRVPKIQRALDQSSAVRPRLSAVDLAREEATQ
jgi:tetratricopeptide (TPR) repeat protein